MNINPNIFFQIRRGNTNLKKSLFLDLIPTINNIKKKYQSEVDSDQLDEIIKRVYEKCLLDYNFPEQNFELFFMRKLNEEMQASINKKKKSTLPQDIINDLLNQDNFLHDPNEITLKLINIYPHLEKINHEDLDYVLNQIFAQNERLRKYITILKKANCKFNNRILDKILNLRKINDKDNLSLDSFNMYLREITKYPLLSFEEQKALFERYHNGDNEAKTILINSNLRLVVFFAKNFFYQGLDIMDLIQEGNLGLIKAIEQYNADLGNKFSSYASNWINAKLRRAIDLYGRTIRIPVHAREKYSQYVRMIAKKESELERPLTEEEILELTGISHETYLLYNTMVSDNVISLDEKLKPEADVSSLSRIDQISDISYNTEENALNKVFRENLENYLNNSGLTERYKKILILRYGLFDTTPINFEEIGQIMGVSRERIRQLESKALKKLRLYLDLNCEKPYEKITKKPIKPKIKIDKNIPEKQDPSIIMDGTCSNDDLLQDNYQFHL